jgi:hypothetical protein
MDGSRGEMFFRQEKHHRWALDANQVKQYGLGGQLTGNTTWWEGIELPRRVVHFSMVDQHSCMAVLICEDLARPDPVADAIRAVGPNLVICLLMDGPQIASRWSARYAMALADDPGSSVLTLSSLGMVRLCRQMEKVHEASSVIALWRESSGQPIELQLPKDADALVISLTGSTVHELTIDGRMDGGQANALRLTAVHPISWKRSRGE